VLFNHLKTISRGGLRVDGVAVEKGLKWMRGEAIVAFEDVKGCQGKY
jgi:hypothetical protein